MQDCPDISRLADLNAGKLADDEVDQLTGHLDDCARCRDLITRLSTDQPGDLAFLQPSPEQPCRFHDENALQLATAKARQAFDRASLPSRFSGSLSDDLPQADFPSRVLRDYVLLRKIGAGGMGTVYRARHTRLDRIVAIKVLPLDRMQDAQAIARFEREMRAAGRLEHPNIVRATDAGLLDKRIHFLAMEYVNGPDVAALLRESNRLSVPEGCEIARQAAIALDHAHRRGMVHRDIKPSNLMISVPDDDDHSSVAGSRPQALVRVLDFGLARFEEEFAATGPGVPSPDDAHEGRQSRGDSAAPRLTQAGQVMGTLDYMAPEQFSDSTQVDIRADIYSLGATLFRLLTGEVPKRSQVLQGTLTDSLADQDTEDGVSPPDLPADQRHWNSLPPELQVTLRRMLEKNPADRFGSPQEVLAVLTPFCAEADLAGLVQQHWSPIDDDPDPELNAAAISTAVSADEYLDLTETHFLPPQSPAGTPDPFESPDWSDSGLSQDSFHAAERATTADIAADGTGNAIIAAEQDRAASGRRDDDGHLGNGLSLKQKLVAVALVLLSGIVLFVQTSDGAIRVQIDDPSIQARIKDTTIHLTSADDEAVTVRPGEHALIVERDGFQFETQAFSIRRLGEVVLKIELVPGAIQVLKDGRLINREKLPDGSSPQASPGPAAPSPGTSPLTREGLTSREILTSPDWTWDSPVNLGPVINSAAGQQFAQLSRDSLSLYFTAVGGPERVHVAKRSSLDAPFGRPVDVGQPLPDQDAWSPCIAAGGLKFVFTSRRAGGRGGTDLWYCERSSLDQPFGEPANFGEPVNSKADEDGFLSDDGLTLVIRSDRASQAGSSLFLGTRQSVSDPFEKMVMLNDSINSPHFEMDPSLSSDGLTLLFGRDTGGGNLYGNQDIWMATRSDADSPFGDAVRIEAPVNTPDSDEGGATLSSDSRVLFFHSNRDGGYGNHDIWMVRRVPRSSQLSMNGTVAGPSPPPPPVAVPATEDSGALDTSGSGIRANPQLPPPDERARLTRGLVVRPKELPGLASWQIFTRQPRGGTEEILWSPDGRWLAVTVLADSTVRVFDTRDWSLKWVLPQRDIPEGERRGASDWSSDSRWLLMADPEKGRYRLCLWEFDPDTGPRLYRRRLYRHLKTAVWRPQKNRIALSDGSGDLWLFDVDQEIELGGSDSPLKSKPVARGVATGGNIIDEIEFSPDGRSLRTHVYSKQGQSVWDADTGQKLMDSGGPFAFRGKVGAAWSDGAGQIVWSQAAAFDQPDAQSTLPARTSRVIEIAWSSDGTALAWSGEDGRLLVQGIPAAVDAAEPVAIEVPGGVRRFWWHPARREVFAVSHQDGFWQLSADGQQHQIGTGVHANVIRFSPAGGQSLLAGIAPYAAREHLRFLRLNDTGIAEPAWKFDRNTTSVVDFAWSPDGQYFAVAQGLFSDELHQPPHGINGRLVVYRADGAIERELLTELPRPTVAAWHPSGEWFSSGGRDGRIRHWNPDGSARDQFQAHAQYVTDLDWHPNGKELATTSGDGSVRAWDAEQQPLELFAPWSPDEQNAAIPPRFPAQPAEVCFRPGPGDLLYTNRDGGVLIDWPYDPDRRRRPLPSQRAVWSRAGDRLVALAGNRADFRDGRGNQGRWDRLVDVDDTLLRAATWHSGCQEALIGGLYALRTVTPDGLVNPPFYRHPYGAADVRSLDWSPTGEIIAAACHHNQETDRPYRGFWLWTPDGQPGPHLEGGAMLQYSQTVEISPDGRLLLGAGKEGLPVWDLKTLRLQGVTVPLPGSEAVTISSNGTLINATPNAANELVYVIEHLDHTFSLLTPAEFFRRFGQ